VLSGLAIRGGSVDRADKDIAKWLKKLEFNPIMERGNRIGKT
jgi:hypothetical protein